MVRRKIFAIVVMAMLLFTTIAVSLVSCEERSSTNCSEEPPWENGSGNNSGICGGGEPGGPGPPQ